MNKAYDNDSLTEEFFKKHDQYTTDFVYKNLSAPRRQITEQTRKKDRNNISIKSLYNTFPKLLPNQIPRAITMSFSSYQTSIKKLRKGIMPNYFWHITNK